MDQVVDLELWSSPRRSAVPLDGELVANACHAATSVPRDVVLGLNFVPEAADVQVLAAKLAEGELSKREFDEFCLQRALLADSRHAESAAQFLAFVDGQPLAWLHFPVTSEGRDMAMCVFEWAAHAGHVIRRGQGETALTQPELRALWPT